MDSLLEDPFQNSVYIIDCIWELYVVVGRNARGHKRDIQCALNLALVGLIVLLCFRYAHPVKELSSRVASARPYAPTVHVLVFPTQLPRDFRLTFRDLDELTIVRNDSIARFTT